MKKIINKIFGLVFLTALTLPGVSFSALKLEQNYPEIPGITNTGQSLNNVVKESQTATAMNTASLIKYFADLAFILTIGLATLSLIVAGVQYFSAFGNVGAMKTSRDRAVKSFIGVAIIVFSYSILQIVMPKINIPTLTRVGGFEDSNIILFSEDGYNQLKGVINKELLDGLVNNGLAKYAGSQNSNLTSSFGQMTKYENSGRLYFEGFNPTHIGFYGTGKKNIEVKMFSEPGFLGTPVTYINEGMKNTNGALVQIGKESFGAPTNLDVVPLALLFATPVSYFDVSTQKFITEYTSPFPKHPPLSYYIQGIGAGVYLYGSNMPIAIETGESPNVIGDVDTSQYIQYVGGKGGQRYLQTSYPDFSSQTFNFDNEANEIEIKNTKAKNKGDFQESLLAILFLDSFYRGQFRIFFERMKINLPEIYMEHKLGPVGIFNSAPDLDALKDSFQYFDKDKGLFVDNVYEVGNIPAQIMASAIGEKVKVNSTDLFGFVSGASSAGIFKLADTTDLANSECKEVVLCNAENLMGYCLSFTPGGKESYRYQTFTLPMPWFVPVAIPEKLKGTLSGGEAETGALYKDNNDEFADNIRSIGIEGKCLVALFENSVKMDNIFRCVAGSEKNCWKGGPGKNSQIFTQGDMALKKGRTSYLNLTNQPIGSCTKREWLIKLRRVPCASSIAVYPIK